MDRDDTCCAHFALYLERRRIYARDERKRDKYSDAAYGHETRGGIRVGSERRYRRGIFHGIRTPRLLNFRLSFTEYKKSRSVSSSPDDKRRHSMDLSNSIFVHLPLPTYPTPPPAPPHPSASVPTSVANPVSDVINVRCLMIVILNVRTTKKFYRVRYWRAVLFFSRRRLARTPCPSIALVFPLPTAFARIVLLKDSRDEGDQKDVPASPDIPKRKGCVRETRKGIVRRRHK